MTPIRSLICQIRFKPRSKYANRMFGTPMMPFQSAPSSQSHFSNWDVTLSIQTLPKVTVIGPKDKIEALKNDRSVTPRALLDLSGDDRSLLNQPETAGALMSGSGATVFAVLRKKEDASLLGDRIAAEFGADLWCCLCETVG